MSTIDMSSESSTQIPETGTVDFKLEVVVLPVSDADRAKQFYASLGWREDIDIAGPHGYRAVHMTPPGSKASILIGNKGVTSAEPGSVAGLLLAVDDIDAARAELISRGVDVSDVFHDAGGSLGGGFIAAPEAAPRGTTPSGVLTPRTRRSATRTATASCCRSSPSDSRAGCDDGRRHPRTAPARDGLPPRPLREGRPAARLVRLVRALPGRAPARQHRRAGHGRRRPLHQGSARCRGFPMRSRTSRRSQSS